MRKALGMHDEIFFQTREETNHGRQNLSKPTFKNGTPSYLTPSI